MNAILTVLAKECRENLRDRRTLLNALLWGPVFMPMLFFVQLYFISRQAQEIWQQPPSLALEGAEHAPGLVQFLRQQGAEIREAPANPERAVRDLQEDLVLVIPADYPEQWRRGEPAVLELWYDASRRRSDSRETRIRLLLEQYSQGIGSLRLLARGVDPRVARPVAVQERDVAEQGRGAAALAAFLPFVLMFSAFMGGFYLAVDTTAGERERQSLEPLLVNPAPRWQLVLGKLAATALFALAATAIGILAFALVLSLGERLALFDVPGLQLQVSAARWAALGAMLVPVVLLASSAQTLVAAYSKSFREAQTYVQFLMFVPMVPFLVISFNPVRPQMADMLVPFWSQSLLIDRLFRGEALDPSMVALSGGATVAVAVALAAVVVRLYRGERLLFSG